MMTEIVIENRKDFYKLFSSLEKNISEHLELVLEMGFLEPMDILVLAQFAIIKASKGCEVNLITNNKYIEAIGLIDFVNTNIHRPRTIKAIPSYTAMPIRRIELETMDEYIQATEKYFQSICKGKDLSTLNLCMSELINNVYDHSFSKIGAYVFCQFYPGSNEIKMAVSDYGIGIPKSVNNFRSRENKHLLSNKDCVEWALQEHQTTKSYPRNAGRGLDNINTFIKANKSTWKLFTDDVLLTKHLFGHDYIENPINGFKGTLAQISINVTNLPEKEELSEMDWDL